jgi:hypothetical protein
MMVYNTQNTVAEWEALLLHILENPRFSLGTADSCPEVSCGFPESLQKFKICHDHFHIMHSLPPVQQYITYGVQYQINLETNETLVASLHSEVMPYVLICSQPAERYPILVASPYP